MDNSLASSMMSSHLSSPVKAHTNAYTDLNSLNAIKNEENQDEALKKVAKQFESLFVHELLKNMRKANSAFEEGGLFDNKESNFFRDMYDQQLSVTLSDQGMGLADVLYRQMKSNYGVADSSETAKSVSASMSSPVPFGTDHAPKIKPKAEAYPMLGVQATSDSKAASIATDKNKPLAFETPKDFVDAVLPMAKKAASALGLDPLIMVAQSALETGWGKHILKDSNGASSYNLFNIKAGSSWSGESVSVSSLEYRDGHPVKEQSSFRKYESIESSVDDFVSFIKSNPRYQQAVELANDGKQFIQELQQSGYATDPNYAKKVLSVADRLSRLLNPPKPVSGD